VRGEEVRRPAYGAFEPEHAGKMNLHLSSVDDLRKHRDDKPSISLVLRQSRNRVQVEYALLGIQKPIGVAVWETGIVAQRPKSLQPSWRRNPQSEHTKGSWAERDRPHRYQIRLQMERGLGRSGLADHEYGICTRYLILE
jgi:hypothetical protein